MERSEEEGVVKEITGTGMQREQVLWKEWREILKVGWILSGKDRMDVVQGGQEADGKSL